MIIDLDKRNGGGGGEYVLPKATETKLGGIKVGENLSIDANGVLSAIGGGDSTKLEAVSELPQTANQGDVVAFYGNNGGIRIFSNGEDVTTLKFIVPLDTFNLNFKMKHFGEDSEWSIDGIKFENGNFVSVDFTPWGYEEKGDYILIRGAWADTGMKVYRGSYLGYEGVIFENANDDDNYRYFFTKMENPFGDTMLEIPLGSLTEENYNNQISVEGGPWGCPMRNGDPGVEVFGGEDEGFHSIYDYVDSWTTIGGVEVFYNSENSRLIFRKKGLSWRNGPSEEYGRYEETLPGDIIYCAYQEEGEDVYGLYQRQGEEWKPLGEGGQGGDAAVLGPVSVLDPTLYEDGDVVAFKNLMPYIKYFATINNRIFTFSYEGTDFSQGREFEWASFETYGFFGFYFDETDKTIKIYTSNGLGGKDTLAHTIADGDSGSIELSCYNQSSKKATFEYSYSDGVCTINAVTTPSFNQQKVFDMTEWNIEVMADGLFQKQSGMHKWGYIYPFLKEVMFVYDYFPTDIFGQDICTFTVNGVTDYTLRIISDTEVSIIESNGTEHILKRGEEITIKSALVAAYWSNRKIEIKAILNSDYYKITNFNLNRDDILDLNGPHFVRLDNNIQPKVIVQANTDRDKLPRWNEYGQIIGYGKDITDWSSQDVIVNAQYAYQKCFKVIGKTNIDRLYIPTQSGTAGQVLVSNGQYQEPTWIDHIKIVKLTQDAYDELEVKDPNTLYLIVG